MPWKAANSEQIVNFLTVRSFRAQSRVPEVSGSPRGESVRFRVRKSHSRLALAARSRSVSEGSASRRPKFIVAHDPVQQVRTCSRIQFLPDAARFRTVRIGCSCC